MEPTGSRTLDCVLLTYSATMPMPGYTDADVLGRKPVPVRETNVLPLPAEALAGDKEVTVGTGLEGELDGANVQSSDMPFITEASPMLHCVPEFCVTSMPIVAAAP